MLCSCIAVVFLMVNITAERIDLALVLESGDSIVVGNGGVCYAECHVVKPGIAVFQGAIVETEISSRLIGMGIRKDDRTNGREAYSL